MIIMFIDEHIILMSKLTLYKAKQYKVQQFPFVFLSSHF